MKKVGFMFLLVVTLMWGSLVQGQEEVPPLYARVQSEVEVFNEDIFIGDVSPGDIVAVGEEIVLGGGDSLYQVRLANGLKGLMNPGDIRLIMGYGRGVAEGQITSEPGAGFDLGLLTNNDEVEWYMIYGEAGQEWMNIRRLSDGMTGWVDHESLEFAETRGTPLLRRYGEFCWATPYLIEQIGLRAIAGGWGHQMSFNLPQEPSNYVLLFNKEPLKQGNDFKPAEFSEEGTVQFLLRGDWIGLHSIPGRPHWEENERWTLSFECGDAS